MLRSAKRSSLPASAGSAASSSSTASADLRASKIRELKSRCPGLQERVPDHEFSLSFSSADVNYELIISLPTGFPFDGPVLSVNPPAVHPLLDERSTVCGLADLTAFSIHASLPDIVHQVLSKFIVIPLKRREDTSQSRSGAVGGTLNATMYMNGGPARTSSIYPRVNELSIDDLREWSMDDLKVSEFVETLPHVRAKKEHLNGIMATNEALAKTNLSFREQLDEKRAELLQRCEEFNQARAELQSRQETFQTLAKSFSPDSVRDGLRLAAQEAEGHSEEIAEQFLNRELSIDDFLKSFMESRTRSHERNAKVEVLQRQLDLLHRAGF